MSAELWGSATRVLGANWSGDHMVPARGSYPYQRSWDTACTAVGLAYVNPSRAWRDLRRLFAAQRPDGRVPRVVAGPARDCSDLVDPPLHAVAAWEVYRHAAGHGATCAAEASTELARLYPRLVAQQDYLRDSRDLTGTGLAAIVHPAESGPDGRCGPGAAECPAFNAVRGAAELALAQIAGVLGRPAEADAHRDRAQRITAAIARHLWDPAIGAFSVRELGTGRLGRAHTIGGLLPLMLPDLPADRVAAILARARSPRFGLPDRTGLPVPGYDRTAAGFDTRRAGRGPLRIDLNWLLRRGLLVHGFRDEAEDLRAAMVRLVHRNGHFECFHPDSGAGLGAPAFGATAALALDLLADRSAPAYARAA